MKKDKELVGNEKIEQKIELLRRNFTEENLAVVLTVIRNRISENGQFVVSVDVSSGTDSLSLKTATMNGEKWFIAYTSFEEEMRANDRLMSGFLAEINKIFDIAIKSPGINGVLLNPNGNMLALDNKILELILA